jgi:hypothetical protein
MRLNIGKKVKFTSASTSQRCLKTWLPKISLSGAFCAQPRPHRWFLKTRKINRMHSTTYRYSNSLAITRGMLILSDDSKLQPKSFCQCSTKPTLKLNRSPWLLQHPQILWIRKVKSAWLRCCHLSSRFWWSSLLESNHSIACNRWASSGATVYHPKTNISNEL